MISRLLFAWSFGCALAACSNRGITPQRSDLLTIASTAELGSLNSLFLQGRDAKDIGKLGYSHLTRYGQNGAIIADVATAVPTMANGGVSRDGKHFVFHLRRDVRWQDGYPLTARDVIFTLQAIINRSNATPSREPYNRIASVWAPNLYTVSVTLNRPEAGFITGFFGGESNCAILPAHLLAAYKNLNHAAFNQLPIGSGPYRFTKWIRGDRLDLTANEKYYRTIPSIRHLSIHFVQDWSTIVNELLTHEADAAFFAKPSQVETLRSIPGHRVIVTLLPAFGAIEFNLKDSIGKDPLIRRAFASAIDRRLLIAKTTFGQYNPETGMRGLFNWAFDPTVRSIPYDPGLARTLLARDGWNPGGDGIRVKNGRRLQMQLIFSPQSLLPNGIATIIAQQTRAVGFDLVTRQYDGSQLWSLDGPLYQGRFQAALLSLTNGLDADPSVFISCEQRPPNGFNFSGYCNGTVDRALRRAASVYDRAIRRRIYAFVQRRLVADVPYDFLWQPSEIDVIPTALRGYEFSADGPYSSVERWRLQR